MLDGHTKTRQVKPRNATTLPPKKMEDIINSPKFRDKQMLFNDDADLWTDALSEYDKMLRGVRDDLTTEPTTSETIPDDFKLNDEDDVPSIPSPSSPESRPRRILKVTHSDKIIRVDASMVTLNKRKTGSESEAPSCSKSQGESSEPGGQKGGSSPAGGELTVSDRFLKQGQMTQSMMYGNCGQPSPSGTACYGVPSGCVEIGRCRLIVSFGYNPRNSGYVSEKKKKVISLPLPPHLFPLNCVILAWVGEVENLLKCTKFFHCQNR